MALTKMKFILVSVIIHTHTHTYIYIYILVLCIDDSCHLRLRAYRRSDVIQNVKYI